MSVAAAGPLDEAKAKSVLHQVEFYFGDSNLPRDKFLWEAVEQSDDGCNDRKRIGRACELLNPAKTIEQLDSRSVAASPLPYNVKLENVQSFFSQYAKVNSVRLPRHIANKKHLCGSALVEFSEEEGARSVMENKLVFAGAHLEIKPKKEFDAERKSKKEAYEKAHHVKADQDERYPKGLIVAFKLRKATLDGPVQESKSHEVNDTATEVGTSNSADNPSGEGHEERILESNGMKEQKSSNDMAEWKEVNTVEATKSSEKCTDDALAESENNGESEALSKGCRSLSGDVNNLISREDLKEAFKKFGTVRFVDFSIGNDSGYLRFEDSKAAEKARVSAVLVDEGGLIVKDHIVTVELVTGEAEKDYWNKIRSTREKCKDNGSYKGRAGKINGKRGRHFNSTNNVPNKAQKVEATA